MIKEYLFLGFGLEIIGAFILAVVNTSSMWHGKYNFPFWKKRYYWIARIPLYKNTESLKWIFDWNHKATIFGWIPPKHKWNWIAFLFIIVGILSQILSSIN